MRVLNPYSNVNWQGVTYVPSCSHQHISQRNFSLICAGGLTHIAASNYHPSRPFYPLEDFIDTIPEGVIGSPNSEFYNMNIPYFHANAMGSFAEEPEPNDKYHWKYKFNKILSHLQYEDGGGITLNHPAWTKHTEEKQGHAINALKDSDMMEMLDFDDRVLGIEFYNAGSPNCPTEDQWALDSWDNILKTGRRCWGFCVSDHDGSGYEGHVWRGRNILLCSEFTEHECLKAYREGRFYGSIYNTDLKFISIEYSNGVLSVVTSTAEYINIVVDGNYNRVEGNSATFNVPANTTFVRVEAHNSENSIFSNPITLKIFKPNSGTAKKMLLLS